MFVPNLETGCFVIFLGNVKKQKLPIIDILTVPALPYYFEQLFFRPEKNYKKDDA
jgi:hypothetical protein